MYMTLQYWELSIQSNFDKSRVKLVRLWSVLHLIRQINTWLHWAPACQLPPSEWDPIIVRTRPGMLGSEGGRSLNTQHNSQSDITTKLYYSLQVLKSCCSRIMQSPCVSGCLMTDAGVLECEGITWCCCDLSTGHWGPHLSLSHYTSSQALAPVAWSQPPPSQHWSQSNQHTHRYRHYRY